MMRMIRRYRRRRDLARQMQARADEAFGHSDPTWCMRQMFASQDYRWKRRFDHV